MHLRGGGQQTHVRSGSAQPTLKVAECASRCRAVTGARQPSLLLSRWLHLTRCTSGAPPARRSGHRPQTLFSCAAARALPQLRLPPTVRCSAPRRPAAPHEASRKEPAQQLPRSSTGAATCPCGPAAVGWRLQKVEQVEPEGRHSSHSTKIGVPCGKCIASAACSCIRAVNYAVEALRHSCTSGCQRTVAHLGSAAAQPPPVDSALQRSAVGSRSEVGLRCAAVRLHR